RGHCRRKKKKAPHGPLLKCGARPPRNEENGRTHDKDARFIVAGAGQSCKATLERPPRSSLPSIVPRTPFAFLLPERRSRVLKGNPWMLQSSRRVGWKSVAEPSRSRA